MKIFVASTGRSGTYFMSEIFRTLTTVPSYHEPLPWCIGRTLEEVNNERQHSAATKRELAEKISQIKNDSIDGWYFESNQMFAKSYIDAVLDNFDDVGCIYIERNPIEVLLSYIKKNPNKCNLWKLQSHWLKNILRTRARLSFCENILWQWFEIKERYELYKHKFIKTFEVKFKDLNNPEMWQQMFNHFGIEHIEFVALPDVGRNEIIADDAVMMKKAINEWKIPAILSDYGNKDMSQEMKYIEFAKRTFSVSSARRNEHALR